ncbi:MAG: hypothetical protein OEZ06_02635 [Myxococcales bacterium]|nr:hypothetical protein [Myxococcales bacterium]
MDDGKPWAGVSNRPAFSLYERAGFHVMAIIRPSWNGDLPMNVYRRLL